MLYINTTLTKISSKIPWRELIAPSCRMIAHCTSPPVIQMGIPDPTDNDSGSDSDNDDDNSFATKMSGYYQDKIAIAQDADVHTLPKSVLRFIAHKMNTRTD